MGNYNDFDLDIKAVQTTTADPSNKTRDDINGGVFTKLFSCDGACTKAGNHTCADTCPASCGWLTTSCSGHCR